MGPAAVGGGRGWASAGCSGCVHVFGCGRHVVGPVFPDEFGVIVFGLAEVADGGRDGEQRRMRGDAGGKFFENFKWHTRRDGWNFDLGVDVIVVGGGQTETKRGDGLLHGFDVVFGSVLHAVDVGGIVAGHLVEHEGSVFDGTGDGATVVERSAAGDDAADGDEADGWLEPDDAQHQAEGTRMLPPVSVPSAPKQRSDAMAAPEPEDEPPLTRSSAQGLRVGTEVRDVAGASDGELMQVELADDDGAGEV